MAYCILAPNRFPHSSPEAPRIIQMRETSTSEGGNYYHIFLGFFTCRKAGTWDRFFYFPSEGRHTEDFPDTRKIQRLRPGLNQRTRVPVASMLTTRPPKPSIRMKTFESASVVRYVHISYLCFFFTVGYYCIKKFFCLRCYSEMAFV